MQKKYPTIKVLLRYLFILGVFAFSLNTFAAWTVPISLPTGSNTNAPFNIGTSSQQKVGAFIVEGGFRSLGPVIFDTTLHLPISGFGAGKVLTSDANGFASWGVAPVGAGPWTRDLATTTVRLTTIGDKVGIGTATPNNKLQVAGLINFNDTSTNTGIGFQTLNNFVSGTNNTALGYQALFGGTNASGSSNTAIGKDALKVNTTGSYNTAVGALALDSNIGGSNNTAVGFQALHNNVSGNDNTAIGYNALAGAVNASGSYNTAVGRDALALYSTGSNNTAVGPYALSKLTTGSNNTAIGRYALGGLTTGSGNTAVGFLAGTISNYSGPSNRTNTTVITFGANDTIASGLQSNTMVFYSQSSPVWVPKFGFGTQPQSGDAIRVGTNTTNGNGARLTTAGAWTSGSDRTKKHDITNISTGLKEVLQLRPVDFKWNGTNQEDLGFIAQEVKPILPKLVHGEEGDMSISYSQMSAVLTRALQEQQEEIKIYRDKLEVLKERLKTLESIE